MTLVEAFEYVKAFGLAGVFGVMWYLERGERIDAQAELKQVTEKSIVAITNSNTLVGQLVTIFRPNGTGS